MTAPQTPKQPSSDAQLTRLVLGAPKIDGHETAESSAHGQRRHPDDVMARIEKTLKSIPSDEVGNTDDYHRALAILLEQADKTLKKAAGGQQLDGGDRFALEAVIKADGTRPSLLIQNNSVDADHPLATHWRDVLIGRKSMIAASAPSIGRIEPASPTAENYFGTGWVIQHLDAKRALILTNNHVLGVMKDRLPNGSLEVQNEFFSLKEGAAFIDFAAESGNAAQSRFAIRKAVPTPVPGDYFSTFDAAVMTIERVTDSPELPPPIPIHAALDAALGETLSFCLIGYPGPPQHQQGVHGQIDWAWVTNTLFGGRFGVKRLAPAQAHRKLGNVVGDTKSWVFGHDATTLGGNSGSPTLAWLDGVRAFGLHFAGIDMDSNFAHALGACREPLEKLGVPLVG